MDKKYRTYKEVKASKTYIVVAVNGTCIGIFTSFKNAIETIKAENEQFPSYWTLVRKGKPLKIEFEGRVFVFSEHQINQLNDELDKHIS